MAKAPRVQKVQHFAVLDSNNMVIGVKQIKARVITPQPDAIPITARQYERYQSRNHDEQIQYQNGSFVVQQRDIPYQEQRKDSYPDVGEQLDALFKAVDALARGNPIPADSRKVFRNIQRIKDDFPKR